MANRAVLRGARLPVQIYSRLVGARHPTPFGAGSILARLLVSFRATETGDSTTSTAAIPVSGGFRAIVFAVGRTYASVLRRFSAREVFVPTEQIAWVHRLESNWHVIRDEVDQLRSNYALPALMDVIPGERGFADRGWKTFMFRYFGQSITQNCSFCPRTAALLEDIPGLLSAKFSVLEPGSRIVPHHGIYAGVLRYHLGVVVPERADLCALRVDGQTRHWREGSSILFDDTRQHEAWNLADQDRVVLLCDVKRQLPAPLRWVNEAVLLILSRFIMPPLAHIDRMVPPLAGRGTSAGTSVGEVSAPVS